MENMHNEIKNQTAYPIRMNAPTPDLKYRLKLSGSITDRTNRLKDIGSETEKLSKFHKVPSKLSNRYNILDEMNEKMRETKALKFISNSRPSSITPLTNDNKLNNFTTDSQINSSSKELPSLNVSRKFSKPHVTTNELANFYNSNKISGFIPTKSVAKLGATRDVSYMFDQSKLKTELHVSHEFPQTIEELKNAQTKFNPEIDFPSFCALQHSPRIHLLIKQDIFKKIPQEFYGDTQKDFFGNTLTKHKKELSDYSNESRNLINMDKNQSGIQLGVPSSRNDAVILLKWMNNTLDNIKELDDDKKFELAQSVYYITYREIIRQVSVHCIERGYLVWKLWTAYISLIDELNIWFKKKINKTVNHYGEQLQRIQERYEEEMQELEGNMEKSKDTEKAKSRECEELTLKCKNLEEKINELERKIEEKNSEHLYDLQGYEEIKEKYYKLKDKEKEQKNELQEADKIILRYKQMVEKYKSEHEIKIYNDIEIQTDFVKITNLNNQNISIQNQLFCIEIIKEWSENEIQTENMNSMKLSENIKLECEPVYKKKPEFSHKVFSICSIYEPNRSSQMRIIEIPAPKQEKIMSYQNMKEKIIKTMKDYNKIAVVNIYKIPTEKVENEPDRLNQALFCNYESPLNSKINITIFRKIPNTIKNEKIENDSINAQQNENLKNNKEKPLENIAKTEKKIEVKKINKEDSRNKDKKQEKEDKKLDSKEDKKLDSKEDKKQQKDVKKLVKEEKKSAKESKNQQNEDKKLETNKKSFEKPLQLESKIVSDVESTRNIQNILKPIETPQNDTLKEQNEELQIKIANLLEENTKIQKKLSDELLKNEELLEKVHEIEEENFLLKDKLATVKDRLQQVEKAEKDLSNLVEKLKSDNTELSQIKQKMKEISEEHNKVNAEVNTEQNVEYFINQAKNEETRNIAIKVVTPKISENLNNELLNVEKPKKVLDSSFDFSKEIKKIQMPVQKIYNRERGPVFNITRSEGFVAKKKQEKILENRLVSALIETAVSQGSQIYAMPKKLLLKTITQIYTEIALQKEIPKDLGNYVFCAIKNRFGLKNIAERKFLQILAGILRFKASKRINLFGRFIGLFGEFCENDFKIYISMIRAVNTSYFEDIFIKNIGFWE